MSNSSSLRRPSSKQRSRVTGRHASRDSSHSIVSHDATVTPIQQNDVRKPGERKDWHFKLFKTPKETISAVSIAGMKKGQLSILKTFLAAIMAGALLSFGGLLTIVAGGGVSTGIGKENPSIPRLLGAAVFPFGLVLIVLTGAELFTGNTMYMATALFSRKTIWQKLMANWGIAYVGNFIGSLLFAYFFAYLTGIVDSEPYHGYAISVAEKKVAYGWGATFLRGIACNWLVTLALYCGMAAEELAGKFIAIWFPIFAFVAVGFEHSVANMFLIPLGMMAGANVSVGRLLWMNIIPVTLGNIVSGVLFVAAYYTFQF